MTSNVPNRKDVRRAFAAKLETALVGSGKPAQKVYRYRPADLKSKYAVVAVVSAPTTRSKQAQVTRTDNAIRLDVHILVLYADPSVQATNNPVAGTSVSILLPNTKNFQVGDVVTVEDAFVRETATITAITPNVSITVGTLVNSYQMPSVTWWSEEDSEDRLDWLEKAISDVVMDNDTIEVPGVGLWTVAFDGDTQPDPVKIGGREYQHEVVPLVFQMFSD
jgi:hypothetical protein